MGGRTGRGRLGRWQDFALMRSRAAIRGNILARCVPGRQSVAILSPHASQKGPRTGKEALRGNISPPCIQNELALARYALHVFKMPCKSPFGNASREDLAREGPFSPHWPLESCMGHESCQGAPTARTPRIMHTAQILPSVAAEQRERSRARRRPYGAAACLGTAEQGAGGFLSGGVAPPKEFVALWGHRALTEKPASAKRRLRVSDADRLAESREPAFAGRVQGGVAARRHRSSRPAE